MKTINKSRDSNQNRVGKSRDTFGFPSVRLRRLRKTEAIRELVKETRLSPSELIEPIFVQGELKRPSGIGSMPGILRIPITWLTREVDNILERGIKAVIIFGIPSTKDELATSAFDEKGVVQR